MKQLTPQQKKLIIRLKLAPKTAHAGPTTPSSSSSNESYVWSPCTNNESYASSSSAGRDLMTHLQSRLLCLLQAQLKQN
ncbi:hypothetical protein PS15m_005826 [Mucor circinelloides]